MAYKFEKLNVWHKALAFTDIIYSISDGFPKEEQYGLITQIRRASNSIVLNISEGATGNSDPDFKRFLMMASRSCAEVVSCLYLGQRRGWITQTTFTNAYNASEDLYKMISKLKSSL